MFLSNNRAFLFFFLISLFFFLTVPALRAAEKGAVENSGILKKAMELMNQKEFDAAKSLLKGALQSDPQNELLWVAYDSCVRSDIQSTPLPPVLKATDARVPEVPAGTSEVKIPLAHNESPAKTPEQEAVSDFSILEADFSAGAARGDLACILNESLFSFIKSGDSHFLMLKASEKAGIVTFSFNIKTFPRRVTLELSNRTVKKDKFTADAPITISVNDSKANYEAVKVSNKLETSSFDITNLCKSGNNMVTLSIEKSAHPYLLKSARAILAFKD